MFRFQEANIKSESTDSVPTKIENSQRKSIVNTFLEVDESFEKLTSNDDDEDDDVVIPATQDVLSQESVQEMNESCIILECDKTVSFDTKDATTMLKAIKRYSSINQSQPNVSVVSISSDEGHETSNVEQIREKDMAMNSEDIFAENCDEQPENVQIKIEEPSNGAAVAENGELHFNQWNFYTFSLQN